MPDTHPQLPPDLRPFISGGVLDPTKARAAGVNRDRLHRLARAGVLTRLAPGTYAVAAVVADLGEWDRFKLASRAFALAHPFTFLTGWAATVTWGLPTIGPPPIQPSAIRPKGSGGTTSHSGRGRILVANLPADHRWRKGRGLRLVSLAWAAADLARTAPLPHSLVVVDRALRRGADLGDALVHMARWENVGRARWVAEHADPASESPLETSGRFAFVEYGLPMPVSNAWVGRDAPERRLDGLLPWHWIALEGDGAIKYDNRDDASQIVRAQQVREFHLRRFGLEFARYGWPDVFPSRRPLADRVMALLAERPPRTVPIRWWKDVPGGTPVEPDAADWPSPHPPGISLPAGWDREYVERRRRLG